MSAIAPIGSVDLSSPGRRARFPRQARILRHSDFDRVYKQGRRHFVGHMVFFYLARKPEQRCRVGLTVGRTLGGAVERNRIKRRLREAIRLKLSLLGAAADVIIHPKKSAATAEFCELLREVGAAFEVIESKLSKLSS